MGKRENTKRRSKRRNKIRGGKIEDSLLIEILKFLLNQMMYLTSANGGADYPDRKTKIEANQKSWALLSLL